MLSQVSIYTQNRKGAMLAVTELLRREEINILGSVTNDSPEYGIIRMVVSDPQKAVKALRAEDYMCTLTDVMGVEVQDRVGELSHLLGELDEMNISVDYIYLSFNRASGSPVMVFHVNDIMEVEACLQAKGFQVLQLL